MISYTDLLHTILEEVELMRKFGRMTTKYQKKGGNRSSHCHIVTKNCINVQINVNVKIVNFQRLRMVHQKPVTFVTKSKVRKNLKNDKKENIKDLAGPREALAMEALHTMFIKSLAQKSNFIAFQVMFALTSQ